MDAIMMEARKYNVAYIIRQETNSKVTPQMSGYIPRIPEPQPVNNPRPKGRGLPE